MARVKKEPRITRSKTATVAKRPHASNAIRKSPKGDKATHKPPNKTPAKPASKTNPQMKNKKLSTRLEELGAKIGHSQCMIDIIQSAFTNR